jgi:hypothetical protein
MKKIIYCLLLLVFLLMSCGRSVSSESWRMAEDICKDHGGVSNVYVYCLNIRNLPKINCNDNFTIEVTEQKSNIL